MNIWSARRGFTTLLAVLLLTTVGAQAAPTETARTQSVQAAIALPTREQFSLGLERMAAQALEGRALEATLAIRPGYLPVAGREAANALRQILADTQVVYLRQGAGERSDQVLRILSRGQPLAALIHAQRGERAVWSAVPGMEQGVETPVDVDLFTALLGTPLAGDTFIGAAPSPVTQAKNAQAATLLRSADGQEIQLTAEVVNHMLDMWLGSAEVPSALRALAADWRATDGMSLLCRVDAQGNFIEIDARGQMAYRKGEPWRVNLLYKQEATEKRHAYTISATISHGKSEQLKIDGSVLLKQASTSRLQRDVELNVNATLGGKISTFRLNGRDTNDFSQLGDQLQEQVRQDYTLRVNGRVLGLQRLGLDEWVISFNQEGNFLSQEAADAPAAYDGVAKLTMTRSRKDFLTLEMPIRLVTGEAREVELPAAPALWEGIGDAERAQMESIRTELTRGLTAPLIQGLDPETKDGLWVKP